jgi:hypothetical protein
MPKNIPVAPSTQKAPNTSPASLCLRVVGTVQRGERVVVIDGEPVLPGTGRPTAQVADATLCPIDLLVFSFSDPSEILDVSRTTYSLL